MNLMWQFGNVAIWQFGNGAMGQWGNGAMGQWGNGAMGQWNADEADGMDGRGFLLDLLCKLN